MQIAWAVYREIEVDAQQRPYSSAASVRYRVIVPATELKRRGHVSPIMNCVENGKFVTKPEFLSADVLVVSKWITPDADQFNRVADGLLQLVEQTSRRGGRVIADFSDNHFEHPTGGGFNMNLARAVDAIVVPTAAMAAVVATVVNRRAVVIGDAVEGNRGEPRLRELEASSGGWRKLFGRKLHASKRLRLLWFGHQANLATIRAILPGLAELARRMPMALEIVTAPGFGAEEICGASSERLMLRFRAWSPETMIDALEACDMVVIPSDPRSSLKAVKSANRLIESVWAGRFVVAHPLPSYREFGEAVWVRDDIVAGIEWAVANREQALQGIAAGQELVARAYTSNRVGDAWNAIVTDRLA